MAEAGSIFHSTADQLERALRWYRWKAAGEIVGQGPTIAGVITAFLESRHHRRILRDPDWDRVGAGVVHKDGSVWVTLIFFDRR